VTEEEGDKSEAAVWDRILAYIPAPFRGRVELRESAVILREGWAGPTHIPASINRRRDGYENDVVIMNRWPLRPVPLRPEQAERITRLLTDAAFEAVLSSLPLAVTPPLELDDARENLMWAPTGRQGAFLPGFEQITDLKQYLLRTAGFEYRVALADALRETLRGKSVTVIWGAEEILVKRRNRTVAICDGEPAAMIVLRGDRYGEGRTVAGADYGVMRDKDLIARAVSFLRFAD